ncbi:MAG: hypothetical protein L0K82_01750 [Pisciglobus halotolerans]|nr:hypothetical protein [Pisciglobus halotolerans]
MRLFKNRQEAGKLLAAVLKERQLKDPVVLALPRGGVPLAAIIAKEIQAPLDLILVRKIGHPFHPEYAIGALTEEEEPMMNKEERRQLDEEWFSKEVAELRLENKRRRGVYLKDHKRIPLENRTVLIVDDGAATGFTLLSAIDAVRKQSPKEIIAAVPVSPLDTAEKIRKQADQLILLEEPHLFRGAIGAHYIDFSQLTDEEVRDYLKKGQPSTNKKSEQTKQE